MRTSCNGLRLLLFLAVGVLAPVIGQAGSQRPETCQKVLFGGEVNAGQEWKGGFGQGWVFRVVPIQPGQAGYSGWDLVVDREQGAGYPDALLVATPPYNSINEREIGTTFGLRAQDAIGWNPRTFRFLTDPEALRASQRLFQVVGAAKIGNESPVTTERVGAATERQLKINQRAAAGQFRILDARLAPGVSDAASFAGNWALASQRTPHTTEPAAGGKPLPLGELHWMRFSIVLWLPNTWQAPRDLHAVRASCSE